MLCSRIIAQSADGHLDEKKKSKGKTEEVKDNSPAVPPITGAFEPALDPFGYLGLGGLPPLGPVGKRAVSEDSRISSPPPPPPPAGFVDPFAGIVFPKTPKKSSKYPSYGNRYPNIPLSPPTRALKTPEKQYEDPFSHLGRPDYMAPAPPRAPAAGTASSFSYDPFASGKLPPDPEPAYGDPFAGMKFSNLGQGDRLKFDDKSEANLQSCICCERGVRPDKTEYVDNSTTLSKSSIDEEDEKLGFVDVLSKVKVMPQLGNLAVQSRPGKDILTPPSSVDAAEVVPLSDQEAAEKKAAEKKKRM